MTNTPYRPYPATYSFDESPHLGSGNQMEPSYEYGHPYDLFWTILWSVKAGWPAVLRRWVGS